MHSISCMCIIDDDKSVEPPFAHGWLYNGGPNYEVTLLTFDWASLATWVISGIDQSKIGKVHLKLLEKTFKHSRYFLYFLSKLPNDLTNLTSLE